MVRQATEHGEPAEPHERNINHLHRSPWAGLSWAGRRVEGLRDFLRDHHIWSFSFLFGQRADGWL